MAFTVLNNTAAAMTLGELNKNITKVGKDLAKLSSGQRLPNFGAAASDAAISEKMRVQIRGLEQNDRNVQNGMSFYKVALGGLDEIKDMLQEMIVITQRASDDTQTDTDRATLQKTFDQLTSQIDTTVYGTNFNNIPVLAPPDYERPKAVEETDFTPLAPGPAKGEGGKVDVVFLVDTTWSMGDEIKKVAENIGAFADKLRSKGVDFRLGVVTFNDIHSSTPEACAVEQNFTEDVSAVKTLLTNISAEIAAHMRKGGGFESESGLEGIMEAMTMDFREDAGKQIIAITDAPYHNKPEREEGDYDSYLVTDDVVTKLKDGEFTLSAVTETSGAAYREWSYITDATGGETLDITGDYGKSLSHYADAVSSGLEEEEKEDSPDEEEKKKSVYTWAEDRHKIFHIQSGTKAHETITLKLFDHKNLGPHLENLKITTRQQASDTHEALEDALNRILDHATTYGAAMNRLEYTASNIVTTTENTQASESTIRDADMAKEMTSFAKHNVLAQASQSMLAQANQTSSSVLSLLQ